MNEERFRKAEQVLWRSIGVAPTERRVHLARVGVDVRLQEIGSGPPILFVHGASNGGTSWASLVSHLDGFRCLLLDRPGCGLSDPLSTRFDDVARLGEFAETLVVDVLDALGLDRAHVVGTSFGGYITLRSIAAHPGRIDRVVMLGWTIGAPIAQTPIVMRMASVRWLGQLLARVPPSERMVRSMLRQIGLREALESGRFSDDMVRWFQSLLRDTDTMRNEIVAGPRIMTPLRGINDSVLLPPSLLGPIRVPVRFIWGEGDPFGGADTAQEFVRQVPGAELELVPGGHAVWIDDPGRVAASTDEFLRRN
jgi:pimeloyl-ACP methyl ester carboxylesterase